MSDDKMREARDALTRLENASTPMWADEISKIRAALTQQPESEPGLWVRNLSDPQPRAITDLKYRSVWEVDNNVPFIPMFKSPQPSAQVPEGQADEIVTQLYRRFKDWSRRGFGPDDVTWCEVKADVIELLAPDPQPSAQVPEAVLESLWRHTKGVDPETGEAWMTPRMASTAGKLSNALQAPSIAEKRETTGPIYTCKGKGGRYEYLGSTTGAGKSRGQAVEVYRDTETGRLFHRDQDDFRDRMESNA